MTKSKNTMYFLIIVAVALLLVISNGFFIVDDETIVAVCFFSFIAFLYKMASGLAVASLEERAEKIQSDFDYYANLRKEILELLIQYHTKQSNLFSTTEELFKVSQVEIQNIVSRRQKELVAAINSQVESKLNNVLMQETNVLLEAQQKTSEYFSASIRDQFSSDSLTQLSKDILVNEGINMVRRVSNTCFDLSKDSVEKLQKLVYISKASGIPLSSVVSTVAYK